MRLRLIGETWIAICAARSVPKDGDLYIDDGQHHAVIAKAHRDEHSMFGTELTYKHEHEELVEIEESNNPNREWWDRTYGPSEQNVRMSDGQK